MKMLNHKGNLMRLMLTVFLTCVFSPASAQMTIQSFFEKCDSMVDSALVAEVAGADGDEDARLELRLARQQTAFECSDFMTFTCSRQDNPEACLKIVGDLYLDAAMDARAALVDLDITSPFTARMYRKQISQSRDDVVASVMTNCGDMEPRESWSALRAKYPNFTEASYCQMFKLFGEYYQWVGWRKMGFEQGLLSAPD